MTLDKLLAHPTQVSRTCGVSVSAVYKWRKVQRIPVEHLFKLTPDAKNLLHLTGSELSHGTRPLSKPGTTIPALVQVLDRTITMHEAGDITGVPVKSLKATLDYWGAELRTLQATLTQLSAGQITLAQAGNLLGLSKSTVQGLRRKYGTG